MGSGGVDAPRTLRAYTTFLRLGGGLKMARDLLVRLDKHISTLGLSRNYIQQSRACRGHDRTGCLSLRNASFVKKYTIELVSTIYIATTEH